MKTAALFIWFGLALLLASSCSQEKNTIVNRTYHNLTSHYNGFFNGRLALQDAHRKMAEGYGEDYSATLPLFLYDVDAAVQPVFADLDKAITKTSLVVDRHSMDIQGKEYCRWIDDTWLVMGEAQYLKGELTQAKQIFDFAKRKYDDPAIKQQCQFWIARILTEQEQYGRAGDELRKISAADGFPESKLGDLYAFKAEHLRRQGKLEKAIEELEQSVAYTKNKQVKTRRMFILAQYHQLEGDGITSARLFEEVVKRNPTYEMAFYAKINLALAYDVKAGGINDVREVLNKMLRDEKNLDYQDQIYYALAELDLKENNEAAAITNLKLATKNSVKNGNTKGLAFYKLGQIYFSKPNYEVAQAYYDSTINFLSPQHPDYEQIRALATSLTQMMRDVEVIAREDSLQAFALLPKREQQQLIRQRIEDLIQAEADAEREKQLQQIQQQAAQFNQTTETNKNISKGEWYFYNPAAIGFGAAEFKKIWGVRKNEDNWRRSDKGSEAPALIADEAIEVLEQDTMDGALDPKHPNYYWKSVPDNDEKLARSDALIIEAAYDLAMVYKDQMHDVDQAIDAFENLLSRYDSTKYHPNCYYNLYLLYNGQNNTTKSDYYKNLVLSRYPGSDYAMVIQNPDYGLTSARADQSAQEAYKTAYAYFNEGQYKLAYQQCDEALLTINPNSLKPNFELLRALCTGHTQGEQAMIAELEKVAETNAGNEIGPEAKSIADYLKGDRNGGMMADTAAAQAEEEEKAPPATFVYDIGASHNFVLVVPDTANQAVIQRTVADFNRKYFSSQGLKTTSVLLGEGSMLVVVANVGAASKAVKYYETFTNSPDNATLVKRQYPHFAISLDNYAQLYKSKNIPAYVDFYSNNYLKTN